MPHSATAPMSYDPHRMRSWSANPTEIVQVIDPFMTGLC